MGSSIFLSRLTLMIPILILNRNWRSLTTCMKFDAKSRGLVYCESLPIAQGRYPIALLELKNITETVMHSNTLIEPRLAAVPASFDFHELQGSSLFLLWPDSASD